MSSLRWSLMGMSPSISHPLNTMGIGCGQICLQKHLARVSPHPGEGPSLPGLQWCFGIRLLHVQIQPCWWFSLVQPQFCSTAPMALMLGGGLLLTLLWQVNSPTSYPKERLKTMSHVYTCIYMCSSALQGTRAVGLLGKGL